MWVIRDMMLWVRWVLICLLRKNLETTTLSLAFVMMNCNFRHGAVERRLSAFGSGGLSELVRRLDVNDWTSVALFGVDLRPVGPLVLIFLFESFFKRSFFKGKKIHVRRISNGCHFLAGFTFYDEPLGLIQYCDANAASGGWRLGFFLTTWALHGVCLLMRRVSALGPGRLFLLRVQPIVLRRLKLVGAASCVFGVQARFGRALNPLAWTFLRTLQLTPKP